ncbi:hypothetical protein EI427_20715 [Flammeovirga pectinis]|uniref:Bacterial surface antigen (D15) domain-containing protein n=1 Tax=Flammeovirga pectinis TaxID=2494373 RepID=A0A3S9P8X9_9BACT|nr:BamA/TamA family outer membrane protein [Flammeovirga pectinis]AZQ64649.1 hypothetical protein EI427_20715 [Flammeovirga pectinis]
MENINRKLKIALLLIAQLLICQFSFSQGFGDRVEGKMKFIPLPFLDYDLSSGATVGALPMLMFNTSEKDTVSPSSVIGVLGTNSENKSWIGLAFGKIYLDEDNWRLTGAIGRGDYHFQHFVGGPVNMWSKYNTNYQFAFLSVEKKIYQDMYIGVNYFHNSYDSESEIQLEKQKRQKFNGLGISFSIDKRSNVSYPTSGYLLDIDYNTYPSIFGNTKESNQIEIAFNHYKSCRKGKDVLATRVFTGIGIGNIDFNQQFIVGDTDIRGYSNGQYRGNFLISAQAEYRYNFSNRIGAVGFVGAATVFGANNEEHNGKFLPSAGIGFRYTYLKDTNSKLGFDVAKGDGDWGFYFRISESF